MSDIELRLENWALAIRDPRPLTYYKNDKGQEVPYYSTGRCQSIESQYIPERIIGDGWEERREPKVAIDHRDAMLVEAAVRAMTLKMHQQLLRLYYVRRAPVGFICRLIGIRKNEDTLRFRSELDRAHRLVEALLQRNDESCPYTSKTA